MKSLTLKCLSALMVAFLFACSEDKKPEEEPIIDSGPPPEDAGEPADAGDTDTGEEPDETPPDLAPACRLVVPQTDIGGRGDSQWADLALSGVSEGQLLATWAYFGTELSDSWEILVAPYQVVQMDAGVPDGGGDIEGLTSAFDPIQPLVSQGPVAQSPALASRGDEFAVVWLDGRWDPTCSDPNKNFNECSKDLAFLRVDATGNPIDVSEPIQLTLSADLQTPPDLAATEDGYVVAWSEPVSNGSRLVAMSISSAGSYGEPQEISEAEGIDPASGVSLAALGNLVVAAWTSPRQDKILVATLDENAVPLGEPRVVDEGSQSYLAKVSAGDEGFMLVWNKYHEVDIEVFALPLNETGASVGEPKRTTWTRVNTKSPNLAWNGTSYALTWLSTHASGAEKCAHESCNDQVFATLIDTEGDVEGAAVQISDDPNDCRNVALSWDGSGWVLLFENRRDNRWQMSYSRIVCD